MHARIRGCMHGWTDGWLNAWIRGWMDTCMHGWTDGWVGEWIDGSCRFSVYRIAIISGVLASDPYKIIVDRI